MQNLFFVTQSLLNRKISGFSAFLVLAALLGALTGCGSGQAIPQVFPTTSTAGSGTAGSVGAGTLGGTTTTGASQTIAGTVATGAPVAGAKVTVQDHNGKTNSATTAANGSFAISVTGGTPPFMLAAIPASGSNMYSILPSMDMTVTGTQNVNITPITTLVMYELNGGADPASMYTGFVGTNAADLSAGAVASKETTVRSRLPANSMNPIFSTLYGAFTAAVGGTDPYDNALDALGSITSMTAAAVTLTNAGGVITTYSSGAGSGAAAGAASVALTLTDPATGAVRNSISTSSPAQVTATVRNANGAAVAERHCHVHHRRDLRHILRRRQYGTHQFQRHRVCDAHDEQYHGRRRRGQCRHQSCRRRGDGIAELLGRRVHPDPERDYSAPGIAFGLRHRQRQRERAEQRRALYHPDQRAIHLGLRGQRQGIADGLGDHGERRRGGFLSG